MKIVNEIMQTKKFNSKRRVCAYVRVSNGKDVMLHSLFYQVSYYSKMIQDHNDWIYAGVYSDEAISGTKNNRMSFNKMIDDCISGLIDVNEEGIINGLPFNMIAYELFGIEIVGNLILCPKELFN